MSKDGKVTQKEKLAKIATVAAAIRKKYELGEESMVIAKASDIQPDPRIPTGIPSLDMLMRGGFPRSKFNLLAGRVGSGKSTLSYNVCAQAQKIGLQAMLINAEERFEPEWAAVQGVDLDTLMIASPREGSTAEAILDMVILACKERAADLIVIDSVTALSGAQEMKKSMGGDTMALTPRLMSKFFRMVTGVAASAKVCGILIAQERSTLEEYSRRIDEITGGRAQRFYAHYIISTSRKLPQKEHTITRDEGFIMAVDILKATGPGEGTRLEYEFAYGKGIDIDADAINTAIALGSIEKGGSGNYTVGRELTGGEPEKIRGYGNLVRYLRESGIIETLSVDTPRPEGSIISLTEE